MRRIGCKAMLLLGSIMVLGGTAQAQYLRSSYFMEGTSARLQLNPGLQPTKGYFNMPIIGSINMSASSNVLGTSDIIDILNSGSDLYSNDKLFDRLKTDNRLNVNLNTGIFFLLAGIGEKDFGVLMWDYVLISVQHCQRICSL